MNADSRPLAPATYQSHSALQRGQFLHMLRDCFDLLNVMHTAPFYSLALIGTLRGHLHTSIHVANAYRLPDDFNPATQSGGQPFRAAIAHINDVAALTINTSLDEEEVCGIIYIRTAEFINTLFPLAYAEWLQETA